MIRRYRVRIEMRTKSQHTYSKRARTRGKNEEHTTYFALDVVEGEHAVGVSALSLDRGGTLAWSSRAKSGTYDAHGSSETGCCRRSDAVPIPRIHGRSSGILQRKLHYFPKVSSVPRERVSLLQNGFLAHSNSHVTFLLLSFATFSPPPPPSSPTSSSSSSSSFIAYRRTTRDTTIVVRRT